MTYVNNSNFIKAVKFIYQNIDKPINLELIAKNIGTSVSTLKRVFVEATGSSAGNFIRSLRMERAFRSLKNKEESVLEIALSNGLENASAFARSFKKSFGYTPSCARNKINIVSELESVSLEDPEIIEIDEFKIQAVTKKGSYFECAPLAWEILKGQVDGIVLGDDFTGTFIGIAHDNPHDGEIAWDQVRFSAGIVHLEQDFGMNEISIAKGSYAKFKYIGKLNNMGLAYHYIYGTWLNKTSIKIDDKNPAFIIMNKFPDDFKEQRVSIYVPLCSFIVDDNNSVA
jgi:AraC family transcriptional regulator